MIRKSILMAAFAASALIATPAYASGGHKHSCSCGHIKCGSSSSSSSGGSTGGNTSSSSGGSTSSGGSSGGHSVPEPGMLGMLGLGLIGVGYARRRIRNR